MVATYPGGMSRRGHQIEPREDVCHQHQVFPAGKEVVLRREMPETDNGAQGVGIPGDIESGARDLAGIGAEKRRQDVDRGCLPGAVRTEQNRRASPLRPRNLCRR